MQFKTPGIDAKFKINLDVDQEINIPGQYKGYISAITKEEVVAGMIQRGSNLVAAKSDKPVVASDSKVK